jgi:NhaP-type Na+/H+ or K+/H+ antiporter
MLSFLLFAGALHINLNDLAEQRWVITVLAVIGVLISTLVFGTARNLQIGSIEMQPRRLLVTILRLIAGTVELTAHAQSVGSPNLPAAPVLSAVPFRPIH